jgi:signal-transduction protein with cAMP-binding, CBS, and nucleotidyltransferase domain
MALLREHSHSGVLVCENNALVGIFTERDALRIMARRASLDEPIQQVMTSPVICVRPGSTIAEALERMSSGGSRRLPIVDDRGCPLAVIDMPGLVYFLDQHFPDVVYNLPPKPMECTPERHGA